MKRSPLKRKTRINQRRATKRRSSRVYDKAYLDWVHRQPCVIRTMPGHRCDGLLEADHDSRGRGLSQKSDDDKAIPCCKLGHQQRHMLAGPFKGWTRAQMHAWRDTVLALMQHRYQLHSQHQHQIAIIYDNEEGT